MPTDDKAPDLANFANEAWRQWEKTMSAWWDQVLDSPSFLDAMGSNASAFSQSREAYCKSVDEQLERMHLPTRGDLVRLTRIATLLEKRLLEAEDRNLELMDALAAQTDKLVAIEREALQARIEAGEARLELRERLAAMEARLADNAPKTTKTPKATK